jgi:intraflagellar transport protein 88
MARELEREVHTLLEESATFAAGYAPSAAAQTLSALGIGIRVASVAEKAIALEKAKEAIKKERALCKHREKNGLGEQINHDLTYAVNFNLANQFRLLLCLICLSRICIVTIFL